jgi:hypothetical protein
VSQYLLHNASAEQPEGALRHGFANRASDGRFHRLLGFGIAGDCLGILQKTHQQLPLAGIQNAIVLH